MTEKPHAPVALLFLTVPVFAIAGVFFPLFTAIKIEAVLGSGAAFVAFPVLIGSIAVAFWKLLTSFDWR